MVRQVVAETIESPGPTPKQFYEIPDHSSTTQLLHDSRASDDVDEAFDIFRAARDDGVEIDEETNKKLLRKIDLHLLPLLFLVYAMNFMDKLTLSYASIMGIKEDIHLKGNEYSWLSSMFYIGYLVWEYPTSRLLQALPLAKYSAFNVVMWGMVLTCFTAAKNFSCTLALRFFLGVFEAAVTPGFALITSQWYTKSEQGFRTGLWCSSNGIAELSGALLAYGIARGTEKHGSAIAPWRILFLTTGLVTMCLGVIFFFTMPDSQMNARWLSLEEKVLSIARIRSNQQGVGNKHFKSYQLREALQDPLTWAFVFYGVASSIPNGGTGGFFSQLIVSFGYTPQQALLFDTPAGVIGALALIANGYFGDRLHQRVLIGCCGLCVAIVGMTLIIALPLQVKIGHLVGYYLMQTAPTGFVTLISLISSNVAGYTKKTTVGAFYLIGYCAGNIIGPQTFRAEHAPRYVPAEITIVCCWSLCLLDMLFIRWYCQRQNALKESIRAQTGYVEGDNQEFMDLTDKENVNFVYTL